MLFKNVSHGIPFKGQIAPEYGATMGYFPVDQETLSY